MIPTGPKQNSHKPFAYAEAKRRMSASRVFSLFTGSALPALSMMNLPLVLV